MICESSVGSLWVITTDILKGLQEHHPEMHEKIKKAALKQQEIYRQTYLEKLTNLINLKNNAPRDNPDTKMMVHNLMREMLWAKPPQTIEMYTIKKHMQDYPQF